MPEFSKEFLDENVLKKAVKTLQLEGDRKLLIEQLADLYYTQGKVDGGAEVGELARTTVLKHNPFC